MTQQSKTTKVHPGNRGHDTYTLRDFHRSYQRKSRQRITRKDHTSILKTFGVVLGEQMMHCRKQKLPKLGTLAVYQVAAEDDFTPAAIDRVQTLKERKPVWLTNFHSEGRIFTIKWIPSETLVGRHYVGWFFRKGKLLQAISRDHIKAGNIDYPTLKYV